MSGIYNVLVLGASYGSLFATKLALAGHDVTLTCLPKEVDLINSQGAIVRFPVRNRSEMVEINSRTLRGEVRAATPDNVDLDHVDLVVLAMQEPQYSSAGLRNVLTQIARRKLPTMSIMNMPPKAFLRRMTGLDVDALSECFTSSAIWDAFDPGAMTLCSPDPQAFRPPDEGLNVLQVTLPTNFKAAAFARPDDTAMLWGLQDDIERARFVQNGETLEIPVKLKVHGSVFVPTAKWAMLLTGNYRCVQADEMRSIRDAVHSDLGESRAMYAWVQDVCMELGARAEDLVAFEKYAAAAQGLSKPSSAARALSAGAVSIERVDLLVQRIAAQVGMENDVLNATVEIVDRQLELNRSTLAVH